MGAETGAVQPCVGFEDVLGIQATRVLLGEAGEHLVLANLLRRGYVASQAPRAWKADDILVQGGPRLQVKATVGGVKYGWVVGHVDADEDRFYALVDFKDGSAPVCYVVPSQTVRRAAELNHGLWMRTHPTSQSPILKVQDPFRQDVEGFPPGWLVEFREAWGSIPLR